MMKRFCTVSASSVAIWLRVLAVVTLVMIGVADLGAIPPEDVPNPQLRGANEFVADPDHLLSAATENYVNQHLDELRKTTTCEMAVAVIRSTGGESIEDYAYRLFNMWGLGASDKNNGVLLLIAVDDRRARIEVGSGAEGELPDITCGKIIRHTIAPAMKEGNVNQAVTSAVDKIYQVLTNPEVAEVLRSENTGTVRRVQAIGRDALWNFLGLVVLCVFLFTLAMFIFDLVRVAKRDNYRRAMTWRSHLSTYWWGAGLSLGLALPIALLALWMYRHARDKKEICDTCGAKMNKLSEDEDNAYLSPSQDFEEKLGTVDYDVWLCPECGTVERFPYVEKQLKYRECPDCHTIAMNLVMDKVVEKPTVHKAGHGERLYQCQFCRHRHREGYAIPKKEDPNVAAAAILGAPIGSAGRRGGGGGGFGGFGGGGFGGGHSSGGGASGGW